MENVSFKKLALAGSMMGVAGVVLYMSYTKFCPKATSSPLSDEDVKEMADREPVKEVLVEVDEPLIDTGSGSEDELGHQDDADPDPDTTN